LSTSTHTTPNENPSEPTFIHSFKPIHSFIMEQTLIDRFHQLRDSLLANDPSLTRLEPWQGMEAIPFSFHYLEDEDVHQALIDCFTACKGNTTVQSVVLHALPEPELCVALQHISGLVNLRELRMVNNTKSQSLNLTVLTTFLQAHQATLMKFKKKNQTRTQTRRFGLQRIYLTTRLQITSQAQIDDFATCLGTQPNCSTLQSLSLKLIPRCSIQEPNLTLDPILQACAALPVLQTVRLSAGYDHNPYGRSLVSPAALRALLWQSHQHQKSGSSSTSKSSLQRICLENFGLQSRHVETVAWQLQDNTSLTRLDLPTNPHVGVGAWQAVAKVLQGSNGTLQTCLFDTGRQQPHGQNSPLLETVHQEIQLATFLNRLGIHELLQTSCHHAWIDRLTQANHPNAYDSTTGATAGQPSQSRPAKASRRQRSHDVGHGNDDDQALLSLNASYTLLRLNPSLCALPVQSSSSTSTPAVAATHSHHLRKRTKASIVPPELLPRRHRAVLAGNNNNEIAGNKTDADATAVAVSALSATKTSTSTRRRCTSHSVEFAPAGKVVDSSSTLFWQRLSC
jgi:hypothetical protein